MRSTSFICLSLIIIITGCWFPSQLFRVVLIEHFEQSFRGANSLQMLLGDNYGPLMRGLTLDSLFITGITPNNCITVIKDTTGIKNTSSIKGKIAKDSLINEHLINGHIISKGNTSISISIVPSQEPDSFFINGIGSYDIIDTCTSEVYFSAKIHIVNTYHPLSILENSHFPVYFNQVLINHLKHKTEPATRVHTPTDNIRVDVAIDRIVLNGKDKRIFMLDYDTIHPVYIRDELIGEIKFSPPRSHFDKLIDIAGINGFVRRRYRKLIDRYLEN